MNLFIQNPVIPDRGKRIFLRIAAILTAAAALFLTGCNSGSIAGGSGTETPNRLCMKWEVTDQDSKFASFELTEDEIYIVIEREENQLSKGRESMIIGTSFFHKTAPLFKAAQSTTELSKIHTGRYIVSGSKINLIDFGVLEIDTSSTLAASVIKLQLYDMTDSNTPVLSDEEYRFNVKRTVDLIAPSTNTDLLCRHWRLVSRKLGEREMGINEIKVLFSKLGTYLTTETYPDTGRIMTVTNLGQWGWIDESETRLRYSTSTAHGTMDVILTETKLTTIENDGSAMDVTSEYELVE